jgi:hypothetical protein
MGWVESSRRSTSCRRWRRGGPPAGGESVRATPGGELVTCSGGEEGAGAQGRKGRVTQGKKGQASLVHRRPQPPTSK